MFLLRCALVVMLIVGMPLAAMAEQVSLLQDVSYFGSSRPLIQMQQGEAGEGRSGTAGSLFAGQKGGSLFAPYPERPARRAGLLLGGDDLQVELIRALIGRAEAGTQGYDAVQYGAVKRPAQPPTAMTIAQIFDWIDRTPGQNHAIGRYQFIPDTLLRLVGGLGVGADEVFAPRLQDRLADALLAEAGLDAVRSGEIGRHVFMNNMAKIWAGLPNSSGKSHYEGYAGNKSTMTWAYFDTQMGKIFPG